MDKSASDQTNSGSEESYPHEKTQFSCLCSKPNSDASRLDVQIRVCGHSSVY